MNNFKIRFSDILRYFILGGIEYLLCSIIVDRSAFTEISDAVKNVFGDAIISQPAMRIAAVCVGIYLLGFITQSIIQLLYGGDFLGTGIGEVAELIRYYPSKWWLDTRGYPDWIYWSDRPRRVLDIYKDILETDENAEIKTEFLYSNQLFQATAFAIVLATVCQYLISLGSLCGVSILLILTSLLLFLWFIHWLCGQLKMIIVPVVLGLLVSIAILFMGRAGSENCSWFQGCILAFSYLISYLLAASLARKQIRRVDILARYNSDKVKAERFRNVLARVGVPKFYILTRTNSPEYISEEFESICDQTYPNIKVVVLLDGTLNDNKAKRDLLFKTIDAFQDRLNIQTYESSHSGPAALAYEIRQIFLNYANSDDVAMILDSDDKLYSPSVVSQIMTKLFKTKSNICLIRFEIFGKQNLNYTRNHHNEFVKRLCYKGDIAKEGVDKLVRQDCVKEERIRAITPVDLRDCNELHRISTIGWTKCYRKGILSEYQEKLNKYLDDHKEESIDDRKYEDFTDIIALMQPDARICAVAKNSVLFRKSGNSVTTNVSADNYSEQIPFFLHLAKELANDNKESLIDKSVDIVTKKLLPYKFVQYLNVVYKKTTSKEGMPGYDEVLEESGYNCDTFHTDFLINVFGDRKAQAIPDEMIVDGFHDDVVTLLNGYDYDILGAFPEGIAKAKKDQGITWETVCTTYSIKQ